MNRPPLRFPLALGAWGTFAVGTLVAPSLVPRGPVLALAVGAILSLAAVRYDLAPVLARTRLHLALVVLPTAAIVVWMFDALVSGSVLRGSLSVLLGLAATGGAGLAVLVAADNRYAADRMANQSVLVEWTGGPTRTRRRWQRVGFVALGVGCIVAGVATWFLARDLADVGGSLLASLGGGFVGSAYSTGRSVRYTALEGGIVVRPFGAVRSVYLPWSRFTGVERTSEELVLRRRLPGTSFHCALSDVADPDDVEATLHERLDGRRP
ncbi:hypothetical protein [Halomarina ordinaria]|uniref:PH domain-containing protein n=1 Tax=Halomarina ordinaria TaxID=3033939 RepID=A0ABD5U5P1_9EURY|nr:hypothetical protein [Halomarina sp. PSRA2]